MKHILQVLLFSIVLCIKVNCLTDSHVMEPTLISDYLKGNNLKTCVLLSCEKNQDHLQLFNLFNDKSDVWFNFFDISNDLIEFETLLMRLSHQIGIVIDLNCSEIVKFLREISKRMYFHRERYWLMFARDMNQTFHVLRKQNINTDAEISIAIPVEDGSKKNYQIYDAHNPSFVRGGQLNVSKTGMWSLSNGYTLIENKTKIENRRNFNGVTFKGVVTIPKTPKDETFLDHLQSVDFPHINTISRFNYRLFDIMKEMYNFNIFLQRSNSLGFLNNNGRWEGAIGMINRQEVDIAESGFQWRIEYYDAIDATTNSYASRVKFIFQHPRLFDVSTVFTEPFVNVVWLGIVVVCIFAAYFLRHIFTAENHGKVKVNFSNQSINDATWSNSLLLVFGILFQQGYSTEPLMISSRILTLTILIFSVLVSQFYSAFIVGTLLTEAPKSIKTVKQLERSKIELGVDDVPYVLEHFEQMNAKPTVKLYERIIKTKEKSIMDLSDGLDLIKRGGFAFNTEASSSYLILEKILTDDEICDLQDVSYSREIPTGPILPKKSPLTELIKISILRMAETGILAYHSKIWVGSRPDCPDRIIAFIPVDLLNFSTALYLIIYGIVMSTLILFFEIFLHRYQQGKGIDFRDSVKHLFNFSETENKKSEG